MKKHRSPILFLLLIFICVSTQAKVCRSDSEFKMGTGIYDITGPAAEEGMMGYGMLQQKTAGISQRLWSRAFVIESICDNKKVVIVNADLGQIFQAIKEQVVQRLRKKYGDQYSDDNVLLTATHTHSGPGGYSTYALYNITTLGFDRNHFDAIVNGIVKSIERAEKNKVNGTIRIAKGMLSGISFNRSPQAYLLNPKNEIARYDNNVDIDMTLLRFDSLDHQSIGMINWFPLHGVSMNNKNKLISGDNKGYAESRFENDFNSNYDDHAFVGAFAQANAGDVSPNPYGHEGDSGELGLKAIARAGEAQYQKAKELYKEAKQKVQGDIDYRHEFVAMDQVRVDSKYTNGNIEKTCPAAIGVSMLAGTQDGEGFGYQGLSCKDLSGVFSSLSCWLTTTECQGVKPIALSTGTQKPYPWTPNILPLQLIKIGNVVIVAAPFELTTMTGRRIRNAVQSIFKDDVIIIASLSNAYAGYVATREEYELQRYEAASTHFGPWQQAALVQEFTKLAEALRDGKAVKPELTPPDLLDQQSNLQTGVWFDDVPLFQFFGAIETDVKSIYSPGDQVDVTFWGAHPRNNYRTQDSFLEVQQWRDDEFKTIRKDRDFDTEYQWMRSGLSYSLIKIVWHIPNDMPSGRYRIIHHGDWKSTWGGVITEYSGLSSIFEIK